MDVQAYLDRIHYAGSTEPTLHTLRNLHMAHLLSVPFENLSIFQNQPLSLREADLFEKIVTRRRGGFCYELNGLFAALLRTLGYKVTLLSARVVGKNRHLGAEFDHLVLQVALSEPWLADVGFGESFRLPLRLDTDKEQMQGDSAFRIVEQGDGRVLQRRERGEGWNDQYHFTLQPRHFEEFEPMCLYHRTSPLSSFTRGRVCSLATPDGRVTISDMRLIVTRYGRRTEHVMGDEQEVNRVLADVFGIE
jgi:N-hydroxyarylamine O-acetyltransferase